jgi:hypothetical protein
MMRHCFFPGILDSIYGSVVHSLCLLPAAVDSCCSSNLLLLAISFVLYFVIKFFNLPEANLSNAVSL